MLRIYTADGSVANGVDLRGVIEPGQHTIRSRKPTPQGLCIVPWPRAAERLYITVSTECEEGTVEVDAFREDPERVIEVRMKPIANRDAAQ